MIRESIRQALDSIKSNRLRSVLTLLGVVIGVASVVAMMSIGEGLKTAVLSELRELGSDVVIVYPGADDSSIVVEESRLVQLTYDDVGAIKERSADVTYVAPELKFESKARVGEEIARVLVNGTVPDISGIRGFQASEGRLLHWMDIDKSSWVAVLGSATAKDLYGSSSPIGRTITISGRELTVVGVLKPTLKSSVSTGVEKEDRMVLIPEPVARRAFGQDKLGYLYVKVADIPRATQQIKAVLEARHPGAVYSVMSQEQILQKVGAVAAGFSAFLGAIGAISLVVGGIGVMNIMLVSVTERTAEIGIRRALGASKRDILLQFLMESVFLTVIGGVAGILVGNGVNSAVTASGKWTPSVSPTVVIVGFTASVLVGVFFGTYPARRAANLDPADALRR